VEGNYLREGVWYRGVVTAAHADEGTFDLLYDDGDVETKVACPFIRKLEEIIVNETVAVGDAVECNFRGEGQWFAGTVRSVRSDGAIDVDYEDGDVEEAVSAHNFRRSVDVGALPVPSRRPRSSSPAREPHKPWNSYFNALPARKVTPGGLSRKQCQCRNPGVDCHRVGGCLFVALKTVPLEAIQRPLFSYRKLCDCGGLCGCGTSAKEHLLEDVTQETGEPLLTAEAPLIERMSFAMQTDDPPEMLDEEVQHVPTTADAAAQHEVGKPVARAMQTENPTRERPTQTDLVTAETSLQHDTPLLLDQACQTIDFNKPRLRSTPRVAFEDRPPFVVKTVCACAPKGHTAACACCNAEQRVKRSEQPSPPPRKTDSAASMKNLWMRWTMEHHTFSNVALLPSELEAFTGGVKEFLIAPSEALSLEPRGAFFKPYAHILDEPDLSHLVVASTKDKTVLPSLKYFLMDKKSSRDAKSSGLIVRSLSNDQRLQNKIFLRECRVLWRKAAEVLNLLVIKYVLVAMKEKEKAKAIPFPSNHSPRGLRRLETKALYEFGLKKLRQMLEEDEDKRLRDETEKALEKLKESASSHEQFVRKKDG
jgi:hypothetical protein